MKTFTKKIGVKKLLSIALFTFTFSLFPHFCNAQYADLVDFSGTAGSYIGASPAGDLTLSPDGVLYGMTGYGGTSGNGNLFSFNTNTDVYTNIINFSGTSGSYIGYRPKGDLSLTVGILFGMTVQGGTNGDGNLFSFNTNTDVYTNIINFSGTTGSYIGYRPYGSLARSPVYFYGMGDGEGSSSGNIFSLTIGGSGYINLVNFSGTSGPYIGYDPFGSLIISTDGTLYGMTSAGGTNGHGNVFSYNPTTFTFTDLVDFTGTSGSYIGLAPQGSLTLSSSGVLYGMTTEGGTNGDGNIFSYNLNTNTYTDLVDFSGTVGPHSGEAPMGSLTLSLAGVLYGMTAGGGAHSAGNIFSYNPATNTFIDLVDFTGSGGSYVGSSPLGSLTLSPAGVLYGMTAAGGAHLDGNIFSYTLLSIASTSATANVICNGGSNGQATASASGGASPYTYSWSNGSTSNPTGSTLSAGTYTVTVTDNVGSSVTAGVTITQPTAVGLTISSVTNILCYGQTGSATANAATGGTPFEAFTFGNINTVAGNGTQGYNNDGIAATASELRSPQGVAVDGSGNIYIADVVNNRIRKVNTSGTISTVAGNGTAGYSGNAAAATAAELDFPAGVAVDGSGNLYIADEGNNVIRKVSTSGIITTIAGGGGSISNGIAATTEQLSNPTGVAVSSSGNIYIADGTNRVLEINTSGIINTIAGNITAGYNGDGIAATAAELHGSAGVSVDAAGNVYIADELNHRIRKINTSGIISTIAGNGTGGYNNDGIAATAAELYQPQGVSADAYGNVFIADYQNNRTRMVNGLGIISTVAGNGTGSFSGDGGAATAAEINGAIGVTVDGSDNIYIVDIGNARIRKVTPTGSTPFYTYSWAPSGGTGLTMSSVSAGTFTITTNDNNGCAASATATITQPANPLGITIATYSPSACSFNGGSATANAAIGGTPPYTYSWSYNGGTNLTASNLIATLYTITVTDNNNCTAMATVQILGSNPIQLEFYQQTNISCYGGTASAYVIDQNGNSDSYSWSPIGDFGATASNLSAGTYTVSAISTNYGCMDAITVTITQPAAPLSISINGAFPDICDFNGIVEANAATGGTSPYTYSWSPSGGTNLEIINTSAGVYTITATDHNGCTNTASVGLSPGNSPPYVNVGSITNISCYGGTGSASVNTNVFNLEYPGGNLTWLPSGGSGPGASNLSAGTYTVIVNASGGNCLTSCTVTITQPAAPLGISIASVTNGSCSTSGTATANAATGGTSPYTYSWSPSGGSSFFANGLSGGTYTITATDNNGCSAIASATITQSSGIGISLSSLINPSCNPNSGSITFNSPSGGIPPYTYAWIPGGGNNLTATGLSGGSYTIIVFDNSGCFVQSTATITQSAGTLKDTAIVTSNVTCNSVNNGSGYVSISIGAAPFTYSWSNGVTVSSVSGLSAGTYTITVEDNNGCSLTQSITIKQPAAIGLNMVIQNNVSCYGGGNGIAKVGVSGGSTPYMYSWSAGSTTYLASNLSAGTYTVNITDRNDCSNSATAIITQPIALSTSTSITYPNCTVATGSASIGVSGGTPPYVYIWSPPVTTTAAATGLSARTYVVSVKDAHGCVSALTFAISQPPVLRDSIIRASLVEVSCGSTNNGSATVGVKYGTQPYTYSWSNGNTTATASGLTTGTYSATVRDANTCSAMTSVTITQTAGLSITTIIPNNVSCNGGTNGIAKAGVSGGVSPYTYFWSPGGGTAYLANNLSAGTYTVSITDRNGCNNNSLAIITQPSAIRDSMAYINNAACHGGTGSAGVGIKGGTQPYVYIWSPPLSTTANATGLTARTYVVSIKDADGCTAFLTFSITQPLAVHDSIVKAATVNVLCNGSATGSATVGAKNGTQPYTYSWSNGNTSATASSISAGTYSVTVMDGCGNTATAMVSITQPNMLRDSISSSSCTGGFITAAIGVKGGISPYTYSWSPNVNSTSRASGLTAGTYSITITDKNGCSNILTARLNCGSSQYFSDDNNNSGSQCCPGSIDNVNLYPNPNNGQFTIAGVEKDMIIEVYDYTGRRISTISSTGETMPINITNTAGGVYLIRILGKDGTPVSQKKVVKVQ